MLYQGSLGENNQVNHLEPLIVNTMLQSKLEIGIGVFAVECSTERSFGKQHP